MDQELRVSDDVSAAGWIAPRLTGGFGAVTRAVPSSYPAYARICHPADRDGRSATWSEVARSTGRQTHPMMQWHALVGSADYLNMTGSLWPGGDPQRGNLIPEVLGRLCGLLGDHTATPEHCFFCSWEGYGWITPAFSPEELSRPRVRLPARDYLLTGPLRAALQIGYRPTVDRLIPQSPNLFWPADQAWCVASEIDFDSTLLGGSAELVDAILHTSTLDSWPVRPDDSLAYDADQINPVPSLTPLAPVRFWAMRTLLPDPPPAEFEQLLERRRRWGADTHDEVWEGVLYMAPAPRDAHADISQQLAELLGPWARGVGLVPTIAEFNLGRPDDYRVPDGGLHRSRTWGTYATTAALVVEIISPGDGTWEKLPFYAAHHVDELLIIDADERVVHWLALTAHGEYRPVEHSGLIDLGPAQLAAQIDWPSSETEQ